MGLSFKENVPDIRNSKSFDLVSYLKKKNFKVDCYDNNVDNNQIKKIYKISPLQNIKKNNYYFFFILVAHNNFKKNNKKIYSYLKKNGFIYDFKNILKLIKNYYYK